MVKCISFDKQGKTLIDRDQTLTAIGLKTGAKLMLIGKKFCPEEDANFKKLEQLVKENTEIQKKLAASEESLNSITGGFLDKSLVPSRLEQLRKEATGLGEQGMKLLEAADSMEIASPDDPSGLARDEIKAKRKSTVNKIQAVMDDVDKLLQILKELK